MTYSRRSFLKGFAAATTLLGKQWQQALKRRRHRPRIVAPAAIPTASSLPVPTVRAGAPPSLATYSDSYAAVYG